MGQLLFDFGLLSISIIAITAFLGVMANGIGENIFGRKDGDDIFQQSAKTQVGWKSVGGRKK